jgi:hypothetical protein
MEQAKRGASKTPSKPPPSLRSYTSAEREKDLRAGVAQYPGSITRLTALANFLRREKRDREALRVLRRLILASPPSDRSNSRARAWVSLAETFERIAGFNPSGSNPDGSWDLFASSPRDGAWELDEAREAMEHALHTWPKDPRQLRGYLRMFERYILHLRVLGHHSYLRECEVERQRLQDFIAAGSGA